MDNGQHTNGTSLQGAPVAVRQRYIILDALRGFALLGIVLANFPEFSLWTFLSDEAQAALPTAALDRGCHWLLCLLVDGKFYTLFSLLFGMGFSIIIANIGQTLLGMLLFYGIGFGLGAYIGLGHVLLIALGIYIFEAIVARLWLSWFQYGLLEWVWRMLTYGRYLKIGKEAASLNNAESK